ncbi:MAG: hypothetical protein KME46_21060 [Brasilonema angustatum HA4187-MV1]|jgi:hypothetical protein|nr:hypothetical protein [Brasilonema angustatum HA4187-MV1]
MVKLRKAITTKGVTTKGVTPMTEYQDFMAVASKSIEQDPDANWIYRYIIDGLSHHGFSTKMSETYAALVIGQELFHPSESDFTSYLTSVESTFPQLSPEGHASILQATSKCVQDYYHPQVDTQEL